MDDRHAGDSEILDIHVDNSSITCVELGICSRVADENIRCAGIALEMENRRCIQNGVIC